MPDSEIANKTRRARRKEQIIYARDLLKKRHGRSGPGSRFSPGQNPPNSTQSCQNRIKPTSISLHPKGYGPSSYSTADGTRSNRMVKQGKPVTSRVIPNPSNDGHRSSSRDDSPRLKSSMSKRKDPHSYLYDSPANSIISESDKTSSVRSSCSKKGSHNRKQQRKKQKQRYLQHRHQASSCKTSNTVAEQRDSSIPTSNSNIHSASSFSSVENRKHVKSLRLDSYEKRYYQDKRHRKRQEHRQSNYGSSHRSVSTGNSSYSTMSSNKTEPTCNTTPTRNRNIDGCSSNSSSDSQGSQLSYSKPNKKTLKISRRTRVHCDAVTVQRQDVQDDSTFLNTSNETSSLDDVFVAGHHEDEEREEPSRTFRERILTTLDSFLCHNSGIDDETREYSASFDEDGVAITSGVPRNDNMRLFKNAMSCCSCRQDVETTQSFEEEFVSPPVIPESSISTTSDEVSSKPQEVILHVVDTSSNDSRSKPQDAVKRRHDAGATAVTNRDFAVEVCCTEEDQGVEIVAQEFAAAVADDGPEYVSNVAEISDVTNPLGACSDFEQNAIYTESKESDNVENNVPATIELSNTSTTEVTHDLYEQRYNKENVPIEETSQQDTMEVRIVKRLLANINNTGREMTGYNVQPNKKRKTFSARLRERDARIGRSEYETCSSQANGQFVRPFGVAEAYASPMDVQDENVDLATVKERVSGMVQDLDVDKYLAYLSPAVAAH